MNKNTLIIEGIFIVLALRLMILFRIGRTGLSPTSTTVLYHFDKKSQDFIHRGVDPPLVASF